MENPNKLSQVDALRLALADEIVTSRRLQLEAALADRRQLGAELAQSYGGGKSITIAKDGTIIVEESAS